MYDEVKWSNRYSLHIDEIDEQHQHLFELANRVFRLSEDNDKHDVKELLSEFSDYMKTHFKDEEAYMESIGFPELEYHKKLHQNIIDTLASIVKDVSSVMELKSRMKTVAKQVLVEHIVDADMKIKEYQDQGSDISTYIDDVGNESKDIG
jgi:hemerythrin